MILACGRLFDFAAEQRLWIKHYDPATDSHSIFRRRTGGEWLVIATDGRVIARVSVPAGFRLMEIGRDRVAGVMHDELDVERVLVFALSREGPAVSANPREGLQPD